MPGQLARAQTNHSYAQRYEALIENKSRQTDAERLRELFKIRWEYSMTEYPEWATYVGYPGQNRRWTDNSLAAIERRNGELQEPMKVIQTIDRAKLDAGNQLNFDLFKKEIEHGIEGIRFKSEYLAINQLGGVQQDVPSTMFDLMPHRSKPYGITRT